MRLNLARGFIGVVILWNLQAAVVFLFWPERYFTSFELQGVAGGAMLRGLVGEVAIYFSVPGEHELLRASISRFIIFDALGLLLLILAVLLSRRT
jgi:hypothetical protein